MKNKISFLALLLLWSTISYAQFHLIDNLGLVKELKSKQLIVALTDDAEANKEIETLLAKKWTFTPFKVIPKSKAIDYKDSKDVMSLRDKTITKGETSKNGIYRQYSNSFFCIVNSGKLKNVPSKETVLGALTDQGIMNENGLAELLRQVSLMNAFINYADKCTDDKQLGYNKQKGEYPDAKLGNLATKTLLVREGLFKGSFEDVKTAYKGKIELVTDKEVADAIISSDENKAILTYQNNGDNLGYSIIMSPATGEIYYFDLMMMMGGKKMKASDFAKILNPK